MSALQKLGLGHSVLVVLARELSRLTSQGAPACKVELYHVRTKLASSLIRHLMEQDWIVYPALLQSPDQSARDAVHALQLETAAFADAFRNYMKRWTSTAIDEEWPKYCKETAGLLKALQRQVLTSDRGFEVNIVSDTHPTAPRTDISAALRMNR